MINKAIKVQTPSTNVKFAGSGPETPDARALRSSLYELAITTGYARPENTVEESGFNQQTANLSPRSANFGDGRGESLVCSSTDTEGNHVAHTSNRSNSIEKKSIYSSASSDFGLKRKHDHMTRQNYILQEENCISRKSILQIAGESKGRKEGDERETVMTDQSDSTLKVTSGDSDLTAERMAEGNSRTSSLDNGCTLNFDTRPPPPALTDTLKPAFSEIIPILPFNTSQTAENFRSTNSPLNSGIQENIRIHSFDDAGDVRGFRASSCKLATESLQGEDHDQDWLELGLGSGWRNHQPKQTFDIRKNVNRSSSLTSWIKEDHHQQVCRAGNDKAATLPPPSPHIQSTSPLLFSFNSLPFQNIGRDNANANNCLLHESIFRNKINVQKHTEFNYSTPMNLLQSSSMEEQMSQNIAAGCSAPPSLKLQWRGGDASHSKEPWQGFYERVGNTDHFCISEFMRVSAQQNTNGCQGSQNYSEVWRGLTGKTLGANLFYQNSESDGPVLPGLQAAARTSCQDTTDLQQAILDKVHWGNRDNLASLSAWGLGPLVRPSASIAGRRFPSLDRSAYLKQLATTNGKSMQGPFGELRQFPSMLLADNARICRPSRAQSGLWFTLQASSNQNGDQMLPQIPRTYLRIKDGSMTILVVKKYLVSKLGLNSESEKFRCEEYRFLKSFSCRNSPGSIKGPNFHKISTISEFDEIWHVDIICKGHQVLPSQTLQHVRDVMWSSSFKDEEVPRTSMSDASNYSSRDHLMILHYQRHQVETVTSLL